MILRATTDTKGSSGPSGMDANGWHRILVSSQFGTASLDLRKAFIEMIKKICIEEISTNMDGTTSIESFVACRLILLNKIQA